MDRFKSMMIFLKIVDTGNFTEAAKQLKIPLASISYHLSRLEDNLGVRLLNRTTRKVSLTDAGQKYADRCRYILAEVEEAENAITQLHNEPEGDLSINAPIALGVMHLAHYLNEFMWLYPKVKINLTLGDQLINLMEEGVDVVLRISKPADSSFLIRKLTPIDIIFCANPAYLKKYGEPRSLAELRSHQCLQYSYYQGQRWTASGPHGLEKIKITGNLVANNDELLKIVACYGHGIIYIPSYVVREELESGKLKHILVDYEEPGYFLYALYPHSRSLSLKTRLLIDFLVEKFSQSPWAPLQTSSS